MKEIQSSGRIFYVEGEPLEVQGLQHQLVRVYPAGIEKLFVEKGIKISQIQKAMVERREASYLNWANIFQISQDQVEFDEKTKPVPGILIRYTDSVDFNYKHPIPEGSGVDNYIGSVGRLACLDEIIWTQLDISAELNPKVYFAFNSRNNMPLDRKSVSVDSTQSELEAETKRLFRMFLAEEDDIFFEALTDEGLVAHTPDLVLLENALNQGVQVGVSQYKLTNLAVSGFIYDRLRQSSGAVREQFDAREQAYARQLESMHGLMKSFGDVGEHLLMEMADTFGELAERLPNLLRRLDKE